MKRITLAFAASALALGVMAAPAQATTLVVDDNSACPGATFTSIQAAVDAAGPGDTVKVCAGSYPENVVVDSTKAGLLLKGAKANVDARTRSTAGESVVTSFDLDADAVQLNGFTVSGNVAGPGITTRNTHSGYRLLNNIVENNVFGVYLNAGGASQTLARQNLIRNNNQAGSASGNGIYTDQGTVGVVIAANKFTAHLNSAILLADSGQPNRNIVVKNNLALNDVNLISMFAGDNIVVRDNRLNDTVNADDGNQGSAIRVGGSTDGVLIDGNTLTNPACSGVAVRETAANVDVIDNTVTGAACKGLDVTSTTYAAVQANGNVLRNSTEDGIFLESGTQGNVIRANRALGNVIFDCEDLSLGSGTAGTANFWNNNVGRTDNPNGLCRQP